MFWAFSSMIHRHTRYDDDNCGISHSRPLDAKQCSVCAAGMSERLVSIDIH